LFEFEALDILLKSLFEKKASVVTIYNTPSLSACCVCSGNSISAPREGGGGAHMKLTGMLVGKLELNP